MTPHAAPVTPLDRRRPAEGRSESLAVVAHHDAATALLDPTRHRVLAALREAGSATSIAAALGMTRQRVNYHVRALERAGLVELVGHRPRRGLQERLVQATATRYLITPDVASSDGDTPAEGTADRFSASYLVATAARAIREIAALANGAHAAGKRLTTLTVDTEIRFRSPADREAFANGLVEAITALAARYHAPDARDGRRYRLIAAAHPTYVPPPARTPRRAASRRARRSSTSRNPS